MAGLILRAACAKSQMRAQMRSRRDRLEAAQIELMSARIARRVMRLPAWERSTTRLLFCSFGSEVRTDALIDDTLYDRARLALPRVQGAEEPLALHEVTDPHLELNPGWLGIPEPDVDACRQMAPEELDFVLVPGIAFDRRGGRLGYGGGFFDYILNLRGDLIEQGAVVAVGFSLQIVEEVPLEGWDVRVPLIVTDTELIETHLRRS